MGRRLALVAAMALLLVACGSDHRSAAPATSSPPSATASPTGPPPSAEACPVAAWLAPGTSASPPADYQQATAALRGDQAAIEAWGAQHPDRFSAAWLDVDRGRGRLVVAVTGQPTTVQAELQHAVGHADRLLVCRHDHASADLRGIADEVSATAGEGSDVRVDGINDTVAVALPADREPVAEGLHQRYGGAVRLTVGLLPYPLPDGAAPLTTGPCRPLPADGSPASGDGLSAQLVLGPASLSAGGQARGTVHLRNGGTERVDLHDPQPLDVVIVRPGSNQVVGARASTPDPADYGGPIDPGGTMSLPVLAGTASCDPGLGYVVPPGDYQAVAVVPRGAGGDGGADPPPVVSQPVPITVTA